MNLKSKTVSCCNDLDKRHGPQVLVQKDGAREHEVGNSATWSQRAGSIAKECGDETDVYVENLAQMIDDIEGRSKDVQKVASAVVAAPGSNERTLQIVSSEPREVFER